MCCLCMCFWQVARVAVTLVSTLHCCLRAEAVDLITSDSDVDEGESYKRFVMALHVCVIQVVKGTLAVVVEQAQSLCSPNTHLLHA